MNRIFVCITLCLFINVTHADKNPRSSPEVSITAERPAHKSGYVDNPKIGGPSSVSAQLEEDDIVKEPTFVFPQADNFFTPWFDWKKILNEDNKVSLMVKLIDPATGATDTRIVNKHAG